MRIGCVGFVATDVDRMVVEVWFGGNFVMDERFVALVIDVGPNQGDNGTEDEKQGVLEKESNWPRSARVVIVRHCLFTRFFVHRVAEEPGEEESPTLWLETPATTSETTLAAHWSVESQPTYQVTGSI